VIDAVYGDDYSQSVVLLTILAGVPLIGFYNALVGQALNAARLQGTVARVAVIAATISVGLNLALVPTVGLTAAAAVAVLTELVVAAIYTQALRPLAGFGPIRAYGATLDAVIVMSVVIVATSGLDLAPRILAGMGTYGLVVMVRRPASLKTLRGFLSG
jgi:O-antigen/teichoic acid export membrane protein